MSIHDPFIVDKIIRDLRNNEIDTVVIKYNEYEATFDKAFTCFRDDGTPAIQNLVAESIQSPWTRAEYQDKKALLERLYHHQLIFYRLLQSLSGLLNEKTSLLQAQKQIQSKANTVCCFFPATFPSFLKGCPNAKLSKNLKPFSLCEQCTDCKEWDKAYKEWRIQRPLQYWAGYPSPWNIGNIKKKDVSKKKPLTEEQDLKDFLEFMDSIAENKSQSTKIAKPKAQKAKVKKAPKRKKQESDAEDDENSEEDDDLLKDDNEEAEEVANDNEAEEDEILDLQNLEEWEPDIEFNTLQNEDHDSDSDGAVSDDE